MYPLCSSSDGSNQKPRRRFKEMLPRVLGRKTVSSNDISPSDTWGNMSWRMICSLLEDLGVSGIKLSDTKAILEFTTTEKMFWWGMIIIVEKAIQKKLWQDIKFVWKCLLCWVNEKIVDFSTPHCVEMSLYENGRWNSQIIVTKMTPRPHYWRERKCRTKMNW